ncbi:MAG: hypothetical protein WBW93_07990 [Steroidobacteraceae bacterium]
MKLRPNPAISADQMLDSYVELTRALLGGVTGLCLLDSYLE